MKSNALELAESFGYLEPEEVLLLQKYAKKIPENGICINIGAGTGTSSLSVLEIRKDLSDTFYTIDIRNDNNPFGGLMNERNAFEKYDMKKPNQIHGDSKKVAETWDNKKIDFLIIDGDHTREGCRGDILKWEKHLNIGAVVFVHDYKPKHWEHVAIAVNELMFDNPEYKYLEKTTVSDRGSYVVFEYIGKGSK
jgi:predicted O-methyltransferase YrrM